MIAFYKSQMHKYGESYASVFYITASILLALSGNALSKPYDKAAGIFYFLSDAAILVLQLLNRHQDIRNYLLFGGSLAGSILLFIGGFLDDVANASSLIEWGGAIIRCFSNALLVFASFCGLMTLFPSKMSFLPQKPGAFYMAAYLLFLLFALIQFYSHPSLMTAGYIIAVLLWILAGNAIRLKYDSGTKH